MSDDTNIDAGSETSGETVETTEVESTNDAGDTVQTDTAADSAGGAADEKGSSETSGATAETAQAGPTVDPNASRTGFVDSGKPGDACVCPDGRPGTIHRFDAGLICLPNQG